MRRQQQEEIEQIDQEEGKLRQQQANIQEQIAAYEKKVGAVSRREQELLVLSRDYESHTEKLRLSLSTTAASADC